MSDTAPDQPGAAKVDPETLVLRSRPGRAIRFKRSVIVSMTAVVVTGIVGTAWFALQPHSFRIAAQADDTTLPSKAPSDVLGNLPSSYGDAPRLGPPLPGDLGKPILDRQRMTVGPPRGSNAPNPADSAAIERQRRQEELRAARQSGLLVRSSDRSGAVGLSATPLAIPEPPASRDAPGRIALDPERDPNGQQRKTDFLGASDKDSGVSPYAMAASPSPNTLSAGSVIAASLITGLRSDLPGLVTAQVTERVYDSATGRILLIPQGARLIGSYDSVVAFGQQRALVVWQRLLLPDGRSLRIDNVPAADPSGYAGLADKVDFHTWTLLKGVVLSTFLGVGAQLQFSGQSDLVQALRESSQQNVSRAGDQLTSRNLQVQPTITIRPGAPIRLVVHRDLVLVPWRE